MKTPLATLFLASALVFLPQMAAAEECGDVTIAQMSWQSADLLAQIDKTILTQGYGCQATLVPGDTLPTFQTMNKEGKPDIVPEMWINSVRDSFDTAVSEGRLEIAAASLSDGGVEGWWIPQFIAEAHPEIKTIEDALKHPELFPSPENPTRGAIHNCPPGWSCRISTENLFKAHDAGEKGFELVNTENPGELSASIEKAFDQNMAGLVTTGRRHRHSASSKWFDSTSACPTTRRNGIPARRSKIATIHGPTPGQNLRYIPWSRTSSGALPTTPSPICPIAPGATGR